MFNARSKSPDTIIQFKNCQTLLLKSIYVTINTLSAALFYLKGPGRAIKTKVVCGTEEADSIFKDTIAQQEFIPGKNNNTEMPYLNVFLALKGC